jgi:hypothetical protein
MKSLGVFALALTISVPATAATITWEAADVITGVSDPFHRLPGMLGIPWSMQITFNPNVLPRPLGQPGWGCNVYNVNASITFQLGGFTYTGSGGSVFTNSILPLDNCLSTAPSLSRPGSIQFIWGGLTSTDPGAWNLNYPPQIVMVGYYDLVHQGGSLPTSPTVGAPGNFSGLEYETSLTEIRARFVPRLVEQPAAVPEPATLTMLGAGLALLARRRLRRG